MSFGSRIRVIAKTLPDEPLNEAIARASRVGTTIPANLAKEWDRLTVEERRSIILTVIDDITVMPGYSKQDRIKITWKV